MCSPEDARQWTSLHKCSLSCFPLCICKRSIVTPVGRKCCLLKLCRMNLAPTFSFYCWDFRPEKKNLVKKEKKKWLALAPPAPSSFLKVTGHQLSVLFGSDEVCKTPGKEHYCANREDREGRETCLCTETSFCFFFRGLKRVHGRDTGLQHLLVEDGRFISCES